MSDKSGRPCQSDGGELFFFLLERRQQRKNERKKVNILVFFESLISCIGLVVEASWCLVAVDLHLHLHLLLLLEVPSSTSALRQHFIPLCVLERPLRVEVTSTCFV